jgi:mannose-6-phosphate isomerase-like protein (cupin superfamily)
MWKMNFTDRIPGSSEDQIAGLSEFVGLVAANRDEDFSIAKIVNEPDSTATRHYHQDSKEIYIITKGSAEMVVDQSSFRVSAGDVVVILPHEWHYLITHAEAVEFLAISIPPYTPDDFLVD